MAATDVFYRDQRTLNVAFAVSCVAMLFTMVWMFADDFNRPYKRDQKVFRTVEEELSKRTVLGLAPDQDKQKEIVESEAAVVKARQVVEQLKPQILSAVSKLLPIKAKTETELQNTKADYDSRVSYYNIAVENSKDGPRNSDAIRLKAEADTLLVAMNAKRKELEDKVEELNSYNNVEFDTVAGPMSLNAAQKKLKELEAAHKKLTGDFDRFVKLTAQKRWGLADSFRGLPIIDGFAPPVKIKQTFHDDLPIDYGGFKYVTRYDRCTTCHLGIDKPTFDKALVARLATDPTKDEELQKQFKNAEVLLEERQKENSDRKQDVNALRPERLRPQLVNMSQAQISMFATHPRLDLFVEANSKHPMEKFGCSSCHNGQGSATGFVDATHTPNDIPTEHQWVKEHDWRSIHDWDFPMYPKRFAEAACMKCHHQIESLVTDGSKVEAPKLVKGYTLARELGCFGCHEISGVKSGRWVGPDLRLEPDPPLESLSPAERAKKLADPANPPGSQRKVGPSLFRIAEKTNDEWAAKWIKAPRVFRPDTKMPHFYQQANNVAEVLPDDQKQFPDAEVRSITHYLFTKSQANLTAISAAAKRSVEDIKADEKLIEELTAKLAKADEMADADKRDANRKLVAAKERLAAAAQPRPANESVQLPEAAADQVEKGRHLFATKGCVACHKHEGIETAGPNAADGKPQPSLIGESNFGPDLTRIAAKFDAKNNRKWLVQWLLNPTAHSPRTLMPSVHLNTEEADTIAGWLLAQTPKADPVWDALIVDKPDTAALKAMAQMYLRKAGLVTREIKEVLDTGFSKDQLAYRADDADEHELFAPLDDGKLMMYIGKKAINNLGCFACHNIPGFESAKPIGVALNDWGNKDPARIAFEDSANYVEERYNIIPSWKKTEEEADHGKDAHGNEHGHAKPKGKPLERFAPYDTSAPSLYEEYFADMLQHGHQHREGFLHLKLMSPRAYDYNRIKDWNDRARMPQFKFARIKKAEGESDADFAHREAQEEADAREAVMTFVLGLIAEPIPAKFVYQPTGDRLAEIKGHKVIERFNCTSCHLIGPGQFDLNISDDKLKLADGSTTTAKALVMEKLIAAHKMFMENEASDPKDRPYPEHVAWAVKPPLENAEKLRARGVLTVTNDGDKDASAIRLSDALTFRYTDADTKKEVLATIPANTATPVFLVPEATKETAPAFGGRFALLLRHYLTEWDAKVYGDPTPIIKLEDDQGQALNGYAAIPPTLFFEGERVQPDWLYQFLLNPKPIRKVPVLQMPKFSLSDDDAMALVNYFTAVNRLHDPALGLTGPYAKIEQRDEQYLLNKTKEYVAKLKANNLYDDRVKELKPVWAQAAKDALTAAEMRLPLVKIGKDEAKIKEAETEISMLKSQVGANDFPAHKARWEEREAYVADAWKLVTYSGNLCLTCHQVGPALPSDYRAPNLDKAWERLRPEWTERWISHPQRLMPYASLMAPNYKPAEAKKHTDEKVFVGTPDDQIIASRDLIMMYPMIADWPVIKFRVGPTAFGAPAATAETK
jgi:cbb3-type cytochrome oxidase cytochrome c subunit